MERKRENRKIVKRASNRKTSRAVYISCPYAKTRCVQCHYITAVIKSLLFLSHKRRRRHSNCNALTGYTLYTIYIQRYFSELPRRQVPFFLMSLNVKYFFSFQEKSL